MAVEAFIRQYRITAVLCEDKRMAKCLGEDRENKKRYLLLIIKDVSLAAHSVGFLYDELEKESFRDFLECFVHEEKLCLVFAGYRGITLKEKLKREKLSLTERLEIGRSLLERMVLLSMSCYFQACVLDAERIYLTPALDCSFDYGIEGLEHFGDYSMKEIGERLFLLFSLLFQEEKEKRTLPPLEAFLTALRQGKYAGYLAIYEAYRSVCQRLRELSGDELLKPKTWIFRLWERIKKLFAPLKRLLALTVLLAVFLYTAKTVRQVKEPSEKAVTMTRIGTVDLEASPASAREGEVGK